MNIQEFMTPAIKTTVLYTPIVSKKRFYNTVEVGDILLTQYKGKFIGSLMRKFRSEIIRLFQGSKYSSSKIILEKKMVYGFGADSSKGAHDLTKIPLKNLMRKLQMMGQQKYYLESWLKLKKSTILGIFICRRKIFRQSSRSMAKRFYSFSYNTKNM